MQMAGVPLWIWGSFVGFVALVMALDLGVFHRKAHEVKTKEALKSSGMMMALAAIFGVLVFSFWHVINPASSSSNTEAGLAFLSGYLVEWALSVDNLFVFLLVFGYFKVPEQYQHRVLFWGILGALAFRALFIATGSILLDKFHWTMIVFGGFLVMTGIKMLANKGKEVDPGQNKIVLFVKRFVPITKEIHGQKFFVKMGKRLWATPLFLALVLIEFTDIIFAIDSVPAIFAITREPFLVFTSNVFAILGLRSLYFALAGLMQMFVYLHYGLSAILMFVGSKMLYGFLQKDVWSHLPSVPVWLSLPVIIGTLAISILASLRVRNPHADKSKSEELVTSND